MAESKGCNIKTTQPIAGGSNCSQHFNHKKN